MTNREELAQVQMQNMEDLDRGVSKEVLLDLGYTATTDFNDVVDEGRIDAGNLSNTAGENIGKLTAARMKNPDIDSSHVPFEDNKVFTPEEQGYQLGKLAVARNANRRK